MWGSAPPPWAPKPKGIAGYAALGHFCLRVSDGFGLGQAAASAGRRTTVAGTACIRLCGTTDSRPLCGTRKKSLVAGTADDGLQTTLALAKKAWRATLAGRADSTLAQKELGGRPWMGRQTTLVGMADDGLHTNSGTRRKGGRAALAGTADDGVRIEDSGTLKKRLAGDPGRGRNALNPQP